MSADAAERWAQTHAAVPSATNLPYITDQPAAFPQNGTAAQQRAWFTKYYPTMVAWLDHPEIGHVLTEAAAAGVTSPEELTARLQATNWYRSTGDAQHAWFALSAADPGEAARKRTAQRLNIAQLLERTGLDMPANLIDLVTEQSLQFGYNDQELNNVLMANGKAKPIGPGATGLYEGGIGLNAQATQALAAQYGVRLSAEQALGYATKVTALQMNPNDLKLVFAAQAKAKYSWMGDLIDQGITPEQYFSESFAALADELELPTKTFTLTDPRWDGLVTVTDTKTGQRRAASAEEVRHNARKDPRWADTNRASDVMAASAVDLARAMGVRL